MFLQPCKAFSGTARTLCSLAKPSAERRGHFAKLQNSQRNCGDTLQPCKTFSGTARTFCKATIAFFSLHFPFVSQQTSLRE